MDHGERLARLEARLDRLEDDMTETALEVRNLRAEIGPIGADLKRVIELPGKTFSGTKLVAETLIAIVAVLALIVNVYDKAVARPQSSQQLQQDVRSVIQEELSHSSHNPNQR